MRRRSLEKTARRWWRLPEVVRWGAADQYAYNRVYELLQRPSFVGPLFRALVNTAPDPKSDSLALLGAAWFEDVIEWHPDRAEDLLLASRLPARVWVQILAGTYQAYRDRVPQIVTIADREPDWTHVPTAVEQES